MQELNTFEVAQVAGGSGGMNESIVPPADIHRVDW
jgi:hypothetical protein